jgi:hypothetical protein
MSVPVPVRTGIELTMSQSASVDAGSILDIKIFSERSAERPWTTG